MAQSFSGGNPFSQDIFNPSETDSTSTATPVRVEWEETSEAHILKAEVPGLRKEEVKVEVEEGNVLKISGEVSREKEEKEDDKWQRVERSKEKSVRRFRLPDDSKVDEIKAEMEDGVVSVVVPKEEGRKSSFIEVSG